MDAIRLDLEGLAARVSDGAKIALPPDYSYCAMALVRAIIARNVRDLHLVGVPALGFQADQLIGAGCVGTVETAAVTLGEFGLAPRFSASIKAAGIRMLDATCPAIHAGLQASEKGVPFMPLRGVIGSDVEKRRDDWVIGQNPFAEDDPILMVKAIQPDFAVFHAPLADRFGTVWVGVRRELMLMAHAAKTSLVTAEKIIDGNLLDDPVRAAGTIPGLYVGAIAEAEQGAWPLGIPGGYDADQAELARYVDMARTEEGFTAYMAGTKAVAAE
mgnify:FL=1